MELGFVHPMAGQRSPRRAGRWSVAALLALALAVAGCAEASESEPAAASPRPSTPPLASGSPGAASESPAAAGSPAPPSASPPPAGAWQPPRIALEPLVDGLAAPIGITHDPGSDRLYVNQQEGSIVAVDPGGATRPFLDITDRVVDGGERGLLGLAFHPDFARNGRFFVNYTRSGAGDEEGDTVISEFRVAPNTEPAVGDPASERQLLLIDQPAPNHNGGQLAFGRDGYLYLGLGDGGGAGDPWDNAQNPEALLGKLLRIDVDGERAGRPYAIPADNPFASGGGAPEVWLLGLRNPWRFSFDRATGDLWIGDVGQSAWEEVDRLPASGQAGLNLGWNVMEGAHCFRDASCDGGAFVPPVAEYSAAFGHSVIGGYVYRGSSEPTFAGSYFYADAYSGRVWALEAAAEAPVPGELLVADAFLASFGEDRAGELYVADARGGIVYRMVATD
jgi:glucose/arabinose dehydrogenase